MVLIIAMALIRFLCKRQMENFYLSSSPGSSTVGATGAALLWARVHCLPCNVCSHFPFAAICFLSTSFPTQGRNFGCQEHLHRLPLGGLGPKLSVVRRTFSHCCNIRRNRALNAQCHLCSVDFSRSKALSSPVAAAYESPPHAPALRCLCSLPLRKITIFTSRCPLPFSSIRDIWAGKLIADPFFRYQFHC